MAETSKNDTEVIIAQNEEEWGRLSFLLKDPEPNIFWINCDTSLLKKPLHDAITERYPLLKPHDIFIDEKTESLNRIILWDQKDKIPEGGIIHIFGIEDAVKSVDFLSNLNFQRDSFFRKAPCHIIFWADFATTAVLTHKAFDFWSWIVFTFDFKTPEELQTSRQKRFKNELILEDKIIELPNKDSGARIRHLEDEWQKYLSSINGVPSTEKEITNAIIIAAELANEYGDEGDYQKEIDIFQTILALDSNLINKKQKISIYNHLTVSYYDLKIIDKAIEFGEAALDLVNGFSEANDIDFIKAQSNLAAVYNVAGTYPKAKDLAEKALNSGVTYYGEKHPAVTILKSSLALIYQELGDLIKAQSLLEEALADDIMIFGVEHPRVATRKSNLAMIYRELGDLEKAHNLLQEALTSDLKNFGEKHSRIAIRKSNLAAIYRDMGDIKTAKQYMIQAHEIYKTNFGADHRSTRFCFSFIQNL